MDNENHLFPNGSFKFFIPTDTFSNTKQHCSRFPHCNGTTRRVVPLHFIHIVTKYGSEKSERHDFETHQNRTRDLAGKQARILTITSDGRIPESDSVREEGGWEGGYALEVEVALPRREAGEVGEALIEGGLEVEGMRLELGEVGGEREREVLLLGEGAGMLGGDGGGVELGLEGVEGSFRRLRSKASAFSATRAASREED
ncbi:hypothetical protein NL676_035331 [Syzygium grande]|nr:hypothetical protein NL676_035331 [Syzygium grande]